MFDRLELEEQVANIRSNSHLLENANLVARDDEMLERADMQSLYDGANSIAETEGGALLALAQAAAPDLRNLGLDPTDCTGLHYAVARGEGNPAISFVLACRDAAAAFRWWSGVDANFAARLDEVYRRGVEWLAERQPMMEENDIVRHEIRVLHEHNVELGERLSDAWLVSNKSTQSLERQQRGLTRANAARRKPAQERAARAWASIGHEFNTLLTAAKGARGDTLTALAEAYGYDDIATFQADALDENSSLRGKLKRDQRKKSQGRADVRPLDS